MCTSISDFLADNGDHGGSGSKRLKTDVGVKNEENEKMQLEQGGDGGDESNNEGELKDSSFHYTKEVLNGSQAILEFETQIDGKYINGVDIITFNDEGRISEFKVMIRPLQAVNIIHMQMQKMLEEFKNYE